MKIVYNDITLSPVHFHDFSQRSIYSEDGVDYLYTHFLIDVTCVFNPAATSSWDGFAANPPGPDGGALVAGGAPADGVTGDLPAQSLSVLRNTLLQPQQKLIVDIGGFPLVASPPQTSVTVLAAGGATTETDTAPSDANNGPRPISCSVTAFHGTTTAIVRFKIETWLNEVPKPLSMLLSNRWEMTETVLEDYRSRYHCEGIAVWRADMMQAVVSTPDEFRPGMLAPPRRGFQRKNLMAKLSSDGNRFRYSFDDEQQIVALLPQSGIVRAEGYHEAHMDWSGGKFGVSGLRLPELFVDAYAEVWGRPSTTRTMIAHALVKIMAAGGVNTTKRVGIKFTMRIDMTRRHGTAHVRAESSGIVGGFANLFIAPSLADIAGGFFEFDVPGIWIMTNPAGQVCIGPGSDSLRGDAVPSLTLIAQRLLGFNDEPGPPFAV